MNLKLNGTTYKPTWWPGNPNPQPGTEEYLYAQMQKIDILTRIFLQKQLGLVQWRLVIILYK